MFVLVINVVVFFIIIITIIHCLYMQTKTFNTDMFLGWVQLFFLTVFCSALFIAIEMQINNQKKIKLNS